ncbi:MAG: tRNA pseudouridine(55) synthase TruB [Bacteroidales bacterium]|nr:tRNA pseudouridine(55) synthase TruB [Bacteroidales bacterium]MCK9499246.1 tRNA pseudouridine(55) synthase TruB [Bacteroidales bacterium]MDY0314548.1 tRNA pseudouridine(55) synthase TruB [Bacteroidales bacterium]
MIESYNFNKTPNFEAGEIIVIDKPLTWSSFDVVNKIRYKLREVTGNQKIKVGHAGTLDPLATGVLIICTGKYTKLIESLQEGEKTYEATFRLGATTPSYDMETEIDKEFSLENISKEDIYKVAKSFLGISLQTPPIYSAIQIKGKRAYEFARKGKKLKLEQREINISKYEINKINLPDVNLTIACSKGTYIRTLANDFGKRLDNGAFLYYLRRIKSGNYSINNAINLEYFIDFLNKN